MGSLEDLAKFFYSRPSILKNHTVFTLAEVSHIIIQHSLHSSQVSSSADGSFLHLHPQTLFDTLFVVSQVQAIIQEVKQIQNRPSCWIIDPTGDYSRLFRHSYSYQQLQVAWNCLRKRFSLALAKLEQDFLELVAPATQDSSKPTIESLSAQPLTVTAALDTTASTASSSITSPSTVTMDTGHVCSASQALTQPQSTPTVSSISAAKATSATQDTIQSRTALPSSVDEGQSLVICDTFKPDCTLVSTTSLSPISALVQPSDSRALGTKCKGPTLPSMASHGCHSLLPIERPFALESGEEGSSRIGPPQKIKATDRRATSIRTSLHLDKARRRIENPVFEDELGGGTKSGEASTRRQRDSLYTDPCSQMVRSSPLVLSLDAGNGSPAIGVFRFTDPATSEVRVRPYSTPTSLDTTPPHPLLTRCSERPVCLTRHEKLAQHSNEFGAGSNREELARLATTIVPSSPLDGSPGHLNATIQSQGVQTDLTTVYQSHLELDDSEFNDYRGTRNSIDATSRNSSNAIPSTRSRLGQDLGFREGGAELITVRSSCSDPLNVAGGNPLAPAGQIPSIFILSSLARSRTIAKSPTDNTTSTATIHLQTTLTISTSEVSLLVDLAAKLLQSLRSCSRSTSTSQPSAVILHLDVGTAPATAGSSHTCDDTAFEARSQIPTVPRGSRPALDQSTTRDILSDAAPQSPTPWMASIREVRSSVDLDRSVFSHPRNLLLQPSTLTFSPTLRLSYDPDIQSNREETGPRTSDETGSSCTLVCALHEVAISRARSSENELWEADHRRRGREEGTDILLEEQGGSEQLLVCSLHSASLFDAGSTSVTAGLSQATESVAFEDRNQQQANSCSSRSPFNYPTSVFPSRPNLTIQTVTTTRAILVIELQPAFPVDNYKLLDPRKSWTDEFRLPVALDNPKSALCRLVCTQSDVLRFEAGNGSVMAGISSSTNFAPSSQTSTRLRSTPTNPSISTTNATSAANEASLEEGTRSQATRIGSTGEGRLLDLDEFAQSLSRSSLIQPSNRASSPSLRLSRSPACEDMGQRTTTEASAPGSTTRVESVQPATRIASASSPATSSETFNASSRQSPRYSSNVEELSTRFEGSRCSMHACETGATDFPKPALATGGSACNADEQSYKRPEPASSEDRFLTYVSSSSLSFRLHDAGAFAAMDNPRPDSTSGQITGTTTPVSSATCTIARTSIGTTLNYSSAFASEHPRLIFVPLSTSPSSMSTPLRIMGDNSWDLVTRPLTTATTTSAMTSDGGTRLLLTRKSSTIEVSSPELPRSSRLHSVSTLQSLLLPSGLDFENLESDQRCKGEDKGTGNLPEEQGGTDLIMVRSLCSGPLNVTGSIPLVPAGHPLLISVLRLTTLRRTTPTKLLSDDSSSQAQPGPLVFSDGPSGPAISLTTTSTSISIPSATLVADDASPDTTIQSQDVQMDLAIELQLPVGLDDFEFNPYRSQDPGLPSHLPPQPLEGKVSTTLGATTWMLGSQSRAMHINKMDEACLSCDPLESEPCPRHSLPAQPPSYAEKEETRIITLTRRGTKDNSSELATSSSAPQTSSMTQVQSLADLKEQGGFLVRSLYSSLLDNAGGPSLEHAAAEESKQLSMVTTTQATSMIQLHKVSAAPRLVTSTVLSSITQTPAVVTEARVYPSSRTSTQLQKSPTDSSIPNSNATSTSTPKHPFSLLPRVFYSPGFLVNSEEIKQWKTDIENSDSSPALASHSHSDHQHHQSDASVLALQSLPGPDGHQCEGSDRACRESELPPSEEQLRGSTEFGEATTRRDLENDLVYTDASSQMVGPLPIIPHYNASRVPSTPGSSRATNHAAFKTPNELQTALCSSRPSFCGSTSVTPPRFGLTPAATRTSIDTKVASLDSSSAIPLSTSSRLGGDVVSREVNYRLTGGDWGMGNLRAQGGSEQTATSRAKWTASRTMDWAAAGGETPSPAMPSDIARPSPSSILSTSLRPTSMVTALSALRFTSTGHDTSSAPRTSSTSESLYVQPYNQPNSTSSTILRPSCCPDSKLTSEKVEYEDSQNYRMRDFKSVTYEEKSSASISMRNAKWALQQANSRCATGANRVVALGVLVFRREADSPENTTACEILELPSPRRRPGNLIFLDPPDAPPLLTQLLLGMDIKFREDHHSLAGLDKRTGGLRDEQEGAHQRSKHLSCYVSLKHPPLVSIFQLTSPSTSSSTWPPSDSTSKGPLLVDLDDTKLPHSSHSCFLSTSTSQPSSLHIHSLFVWLPLISSTLLSALISVSG